MYDNIGGKIKSWAVWIFIVEAIAAIIGGIALIANDNGLVGFLTIVFGLIPAWVSSWFLFGFGQLVENSDLIAAEYNRKNEKHEKVVAKNNEKKQAQRKKQIKENMENPNFDENEYIDITCSNCKAELSFTKGQLQSCEELICPMCDAPISM